MVEFIVERFKRMLGFASNENRPKYEAVTYADYIEGSRAFRITLNFPYCLAMDDVFCRGRSLGETTAPDTSASGSHDRPRSFRRRLPVIRRSAHARSATPLQQATHRLLWVTFNFIRTTIF